MRLRYAGVNQAVGQDLEAICARMRDHSAEMGTRVERTDSTLRMAVRAADR